MKGIGNKYHNKYYKEIGIITVAELSFNQFSWYKTQKISFEDDKVSKKIAKNEIQRINIEYWSYKK